MNRESRWHRLVRWAANLLWSWIPIPNECGVLARSGDVYCSLPEGHVGKHGWEPSDD